MPVLLFARNLDVMPVDVPPSAVLAMGNLAAVQVRAESERAQTALVFTTLNTVVPEIQRARIQRIERAAEAAGE